MKKFLALVIVLLLGFYLAWPAYSGWRINSALKSKSPDVLAKLIDFRSVRRSMRKPVMRQVNTRMESVMKDLGAATGIVGAQIPPERVKKIVNGALRDVVNPNSMIDIHSKGGDVTGAIKRAVMKQINDLGGILALFKGQEQAASSEGEDSNSGGSGFGGMLGNLLKDKKVRELAGAGCGTGA